MVHHVANKVRLDSLSGQATSFASTWPMCLCSRLYRSGVPGRSIKGWPRFEKPNLEFRLLKALLPLEVAMCNMASGRFACSIPAQCLQNKYFGLGRWGRKAVVTAAISIVDPCLDVRYIWSCVRQTIVEGMFHSSLYLSGVAKAVYSACFL